MSLMRPGFSFSALRASTCGVAFLEFALIAPVLLTLLISANELTRWIRARQHMEDFATTVANDVSATGGDISAATLAELIERIGLMAPELVDSNRSAWTSQMIKTVNSSYLGVGISMALVTLDDPYCHTRCSYSANLKWTFGTYQRNCNNTVSDMPVGSVQEGPVAIVDVNTQYKFVFGPVSGIFSPTSTFGNAPIMKTTTFQPIKNWKYAATAPAVNPASLGDWIVKCCDCSAQTAT